MTTWWEGLTEEQKDQRIGEAVQAVLSTESGQIVFMWLLQSLFYFNETRTEGQQALNNFAKYLVEKIDPDAPLRVAQALVRPKGV